MGSSSTHWLWIPCSKEDAVQWRGWNTRFPANRRGRWRGHPESRSNESVFISDGICSLLCNLSSSFFLLHSSWFLWAWHTFLVDLTLTVLSGISYFTYFYSRSRRDWVWFTWKLRVELPWSRPARTPCSFNSLLVSSSLWNQQDCSHPYDRATKRYDRKETARTRH